MSGFRMTWHGDEIKARLLAASKRGIDDTMAEATIEAKTHHPGWQNRTGTAEGSVRVVDAAHEDRKGVLGRWGSQGVNYVIWLELKYGSFLRNAASAVYPKLTARIRQHFARSI